MPSLDSMLAVLLVGCLPLCLASPAPAAAATTLAAPQVKSTSTPVNVTSNDNPPNNKRWYRDGGYYGSIGNRHFVMNFDTCLDGPVEGNNCIIGGGNSFTDLTSNPAVVHDPQTNGDLTVLCTSPEYDHTWVFNTVQINSTFGLAYATDIGPPLETGVGIFPAIIDVTNTIPKCTRNPILFPRDGKTPQYGGSGSILGADGFLYLYGGDTNNTNNNPIYVARVDPTKYLDLSVYSYWNGVLFDRNPANAVPVLTGIYGGSISYSNYYNAYLFLDTELFFAGIGAQIATNPWGPFSAKTIIFQDSSNAGGTYQANALPNFYTSGNPIAIHYCAPHGFYHKEVTITWK